MKHAETLIKVFNQRSVREMYGGDEAPMLKALHYVAEDWINDRATEGYHLKSLQVVLIPHLTPGGKSINAMGGENVWVVMTR